jgi:hypothetical protein
MILAITLKNMQDRVLITDSPRRMPSRGGYRAGVPEIAVNRAIPRLELVGRARSIAELADEVFSFLGWKPATGIVADIQRAIFERR